MRGIYNAIYELQMMVKNKNLDLVPAKIDELAHKLAPSNSEQQELIKTYLSFRIPAFFANHYWPDRSEFCKYLNAFVKDMIWTKRIADGARFGHLEEIAEKEYQRIIKTYRI